MIIARVVGFVGQFVPTSGQKRPGGRDLQLGIFPGGKKTVLTQHGIVRRRDTAGYRPNAEQPDIPTPDSFDQKRNVHPAMMD